VHACSLLLLIRSTDRPDVREQRLTWELICAEEEDCALMWSPIEGMDSAGAHSVVRLGEQTVWGSVLQLQDTFGN